MLEKLTSKTMLNADETYFPHASLAEFYLFNLFYKKRITLQRREKKPEVWGKTKNKINNSI